MEERRTVKGVYQIIEREGAEALWKQVGIGFLNKDDSINVRLDSFPLDGRLQIRDLRSQSTRKEK
ncbi:MAG: hypothetical protein HYV03_01235 [Deltaproteobacteria bacterium]|nr:hypothetical protein [Deltaproteobacteria bacterium]